MAGTRFLAALCLLAVLVVFFSVETESKATARTPAKGVLGKQGLRPRRSLAARHPIRRAQRRFIRARGPAHFKAQHRLPNRNGAGTPKRFRANAHRRPVQAGRFNERPTARGRYADRGVALNERAPHHPMTARNYARKDDLHTHNHVRMPRRSARDFDMFPTAGMDSNGDDTKNGSPALEHTEIDRVINQQVVKGHMFTLSNPYGHMNVLPPLNGSPGMIDMSVTARSAQCTAGVNAGFFDENTGQAFGNIISAGNVIQVDGGENANFGIRRDGNYIVGYIDDSMLRSQDLPFFELVSGVVWLVRNGTRYVEESAKVEKPTFDFVHQNAPRTAIGHDAAGKLIIVQIDGDETAHQGINLENLADLMIHYGAVNAINLDGGGSSATYYEGKIISQPSDKCPVSCGKCERKVSSVICIR